MAKLCVSVAVTALVLSACTANASPAQPNLSPVVPGSISCRADRLTVYKVIFDTFWSRQKFPKQYPDWRPVAQWSKLIGRSHNKSYVLWRLGSLATEGVKTFAQTGKTDVLDRESQGNGGIYDEFMAPNIPIGVGKAQAEFFVDGNHSKVSLMSRLHPSPDWFVGIDSFDLCIQGKWVDVVTLEVDPTDAGTEQGFTFTAPHWASEPQEKIYRITSQFPNHVANSFFYPRLKKLPTIATFTFIKVKEYELSEIFYHEDSRQTSPQKYEYAEEETNVVQDPSPQRPPKNDEPTLIKPGVNIKPSSGGLIPNSVDIPPPPPPFKNTTIHHKGKGHGRKVKIRRGPRHCRVSEWSEWSECSRSCSIGQKRRTRTIIKHARRGGRPCPNLVEVDWCGSGHCPGVSRKFFAW